MIGDSDWHSDMMMRGTSRSGKVGIACRLDNIGIDIDMNVSRRERGRSRNMIVFANQWVIAAQSNVSR